MVDTPPDQSFAFLGQAPNGGAIFANGGLRLFRVNLLNNRAGDGAAQDNSIGGNGGAIATDGNSSLLITESYIAGNSSGSSLAATGGDVGAGGAISLRGATFSIDRSTLANNSTGAFPANFDPNNRNSIATNIISAFADSFVSTRSTYSGNGDGNGSPGIFFNSGNVTIEFSNNTFYNNENRAVRIDGAATDGVIIRNNLFEANGSACSIDAGALNVAASTNNLFDLTTNTCGMTNGVNANLTGIAANVFPLDSNGGFALTHDLPFGSPARDRYDINGAAFPYDQRGLIEYGADGGSGRFSETISVDIGAIEAIEIIQIDTSSILTDKSVREFGREQDWYSVDLGSGDTIDITARFTHSLGDLDMLFFKKDDLNNFLGNGTSVSDDESFEFKAPESASYWFVIYGYEDAENDYDLEVNFKRNESCFPIPTSNGKLAVVCL